MRDLPEFAYIYGIYDPRQPEVIMYVGKTNNYRSRLSEHKKEARRYATRPSAVWQWILEIQSQGVQPKLKVLERCLFSEWKAREIFWITEWQRKNSELLNRHKGGGGTEVRGRKEFCDKCGTKRVRLYPSEGSFRCPICRKKDRRVYEKEWAFRNTEHKREYAKKYYERNGAKMRERARVQTNARIVSGLCVYRSCPNRCTSTNKSYCVEHCAYVAKLARASRIRCGRLKPL